MKRNKICPLMSTEDTKVTCVKEKCQLWFAENPGNALSERMANCALVYLPRLVVEISNNTRLIKASMEESVAI